MNRRFYVYVLVTSSAVMLLVAVLHVINAEPLLLTLEPPAMPARSAFAATIAASGTIEAQTENIAVGAARSGIILEVYVPAEQVGKAVSKGDPLFRLDDRDLSAQLSVCEAKITAAEAQLTRLDSLPRPESLPASAARVRSARATAARAQDDYKRAEQLFHRNVTTEQEVVSTRLAFEAAQHRATEAEADDALLKAGAWSADKVIASAAVDQARAEADVVRAEIERAVVRAPVDGEVLQVNIRVGEYVGPQADKAFMVLGNVDRLHVRVEVDENDIPRLHPAATAVAHLRGDPERKIPLEFVRVDPLVMGKKSLTGDNTERIDTRVLHVIYAVDAAAPKLYVGQQVDVFIDARK